MANSNDPDSIGSDCTCSHAYGGGCHGRRRWRRVSIARAVSHSFGPRMYMALRLGKCCCSHMPALRMLQEWQKKLLVHPSDRVPAIGPGTPVSRLTSLQYLFWCVLSILINSFGIILHSGVLGDDVRESGVVRSIYGDPTTTSRTDTVEVTNEQGVTTLSTVESFEYVNDHGKRLWFAVQMGFQVVGFVYFFLSYRRMKPSDPKFLGFA